MVPIAFSSHFTTSKYRPDHFCDGNNCPLNELKLLCWHSSLQNTYHHYLAAEELKKTHRKYHKKYNTWFRQHEEPKITTNEDE